MVLTKRICKVIILVLAVLAVAHWWRPAVHWLIVKQTLAFYEQSKDSFLVEEPVIYQGIITDTTFIEPDGKQGKVDTLVHRQNILIGPLTKEGSSKPSRNDVGLFGDSSAFMNTIFSVFAFLGVLFTILYQLWKDGKDKERASILHFEQEFFSMIAMLEDIVSHLEYIENDDGTEVDGIIVNSNLYEPVDINNNQTSSSDHAGSKQYNGRAVFKYLYEDRDGRSLLSYVNNTIDIRFNADAQSTCFDGTLDHYFRYLYRILKHIDC